MRDGTGLDGKHFGTNEPCLSGKWITEPDGIYANGKPKYKGMRLMLPEERAKANEELRAAGIDCKCSVHKSRRDFRDNERFRK